LSETYGLESLMNNLLDQITELKLLQTDTIAIDATKLNAYERAK